MPAAGPSLSHPFRLEHAHERRPPPRRRRGARLAPRLAPSFSGSFRYEAFRWVAGSATAQGLGSLGSASNFRSSAADANRDGSIVVGTSNTSAGTSVGFRWMQATGMQPLTLPTGYTSSSAAAISDDNSSIVGAAGRSVDINGTSTQQFFATRTRGSTVDVLGDLAGGPDNSYAAAVSADGSVVVGAGSVDGTLRSAVYRAFIWDQAHGMRDLHAVLTAQGLDLTGWTLTRATDISGDGTVIVGTGSLNGVTQGWIAAIPEPASLTLLGLAAALLAPHRR